jgi:hypothetical protein
MASAFRFNIGELPLVVGATVLMLDRNRASIVASLRKSAPDLTRPAIEGGSGSDGARAQIPGKSHHEPHCSSCAGTGHG